MVEDPRIKLILDHITAAAREVRPDIAPPTPSAEDLEIASIALKVFDRLLPMTVTIIVAEYNRQKKV